MNSLEFSLAVLLRTSQHPKLRRNECLTLLLVAAGYHTTREMADFYGSDTQAFIRATRGLVARHLLAVDVTAKGCHQHTLTPAGKEEVKKLIALK